jgi:hypothetical protein
MNYQEYNNYIALAISLRQYFEPQQAYRKHGRNHSLCNGQLFKRYVIYARIVVQA